MRLRLATRASRLALAQSTWVAQQLMAAHPGLKVELVHVVSTGDRVLDKPLHDIGGKGLFTKEVELALLAGEADFAVHSYKDVPITMPLVDQAELTIAAVPERENPGDVVLTRTGATRILDLPEKARVGTTSLRRRAILLDVRPDLRVESLRGNVDSRMGRLEAGAFDAIILAAAGMVRLGLRIGHEDCEPTLTPCAGQGALALQCRTDQIQVLEVLCVLQHAATAESVAIEREVIKRLDGDCTSPIGAYHDGHTLHIAVGTAGGVPPVRRASAPSTTDASRDDLVTRVLAALPAHDGQRPNQ